MTEYAKWRNGRNKFRHPASFCQKSQVKEVEFSDRSLSFGETAAIQYGQLVAARTQNGRPITVEDAQIAAIALASGLRLATRNVKDFTDIPDLTVINPWKVG